MKNITRARKWFNTVYQSGSEDCTPMIDCDAETKYGVKDGVVWTFRDGSGLKLSDRGDFRVVYKNELRVA